MFSFPMLPHLCWAMLVVIAYFLGSSRDSSDLASKDRLEVVGDPPAPSTISPLPPRVKSQGKSRSALGRHSGIETDLDVLRAAGLALFDKFETDEAPFEHFDRLPTKERRDAIRGVLLSKRADYEDFPPNLMFLLAKHDFNGLDNETLEGIFAWLVVDRVNDQNATKAEAIRRLKKANLLPSDPR